jgi:hypothetical protein
MSIEAFRHRKEKERLRKEKHHPTNHIVAMDELQAMKAAMSALTQRAEEQDKVIEKLRKENAELKSVIEELGKELIRHVSHLWDPFPSHTRGGGPRLHRIAVTTDECAGDRLWRRDDSRNGDHRSGG